VAMTVLVAAFARPPLKVQAVVPDTIIQQKTHEITDICWAISEDARASGNTPRMRTGILDTALCLENSIITIVARYLNPKNPEVLQEYRTNLDQLRAGYGRIIWNLYNAHAGCNPGCGTQFYTVHNSTYAALLTEILTTAVTQVYTYNLQDAILGGWIVQATRTTRDHRSQPTKYVMYG
jgi:hypothetical protein